LDLILCATWGKTLDQKLSQPHDLTSHSLQLAQHGSYHTVDKKASIDLLSYWITKTHRYESLLFESLRRAIAQPDASDSVQQSLATGPAAGHAVIPLQQFDERLQFLFVTHLSRSVTSSLRRLLIILMAGIVGIWKPLE